MVRVVQCSFALILSVCFSLQAEEASTPLDKARAAYTQAADTILVGYFERTFELEKNYNETLEALRISAQQAGSLEVILQINRALEEMTINQKAVDYRDESLHGTIRRAGYDYSVAEDAARKTKDGKLEALKVKYRAQLQQAIRIYTQQDKLDLAVAVREELERVSVKLEPPPQLATPVEDTPGDAETGRVDVKKPWLPERRLIFAYTSPESWKLKHGEDGQPDDVEIEHTGGNGEVEKRMNLVGGRSLVKGANEKFLANCMESNELTIEAMVQCANSQQSGPARIISFSRDSSARNVSICQEGDRYFLRLRTTATGLNGTSPEIDIGPVDHDREQHVLVTYRQGKLASYIDGERQDVQQIDGDFSNWSGEQQQLLFGNEYLNDRGWSGTLRNVVIYSRFISEKELDWRYKQQGRKGEKGATLLRQQEVDRRLKWMEKKLRFQGE